MTKREFFDALERCLKDRPDVREILADLDEYFKEGVESGLTEQDICDHLGSPEDLAREYGVVHASTGPKQQFDQAPRGHGTGGTQKAAYPGVGRLLINVIDCDVVLEASGVADTLVDIYDTAQDEENRIQVYFSNGQLTIEQKLYRNLFGWIGGWGQSRGRCSATIRLGTQPLQLAEVSTVNGTLSVKGITGQDGRFKTVNGGVEGEKLTFQGLELSTVNGKVEARQLTAPRQKLSSINGKVEAQELSGDHLIVSTVNGTALAENLRGEDVQVKSVSGKAVLNDCKCKDLDMNCVSGKVEVQNTEAQTAKLGSVSGKIQAEMHRCNSVKLSTTSAGAEFTCHTHCDVNATSVSGSLHITLPEDQQSTIHTSSVSGSAHVDYPARQEGNKRKLTYVVGDGQRRVSLNTTSGSMYVRPLTHRD